MNRSDYNGWTNYETWLVKLWMDNDEGSQSFFNELAEDTVREDKDDPSVSDLADRIKDYHEEALPQLEGFAADLMNAAMSEVNWHEIAESLINDAKETLKDELEEEGEEA